MEEYVNNEEELYNDLDNLKLNISDHCLDRYSERIMGRPIVGNDAIAKATNEINKTLGTDYDISALYSYNEELKAYNKESDAVKDAQKNAEKLRN